MIKICFFYYNCIDFYEYIKVILLNTPIDSIDNIIIRCHLSKDYGKKEIRVNIHNVGLIYMLE